ncbi:hypothetical protein QE152_g27770 [Popillia japonica]|uniref:Uncharacterized protein n=1 Tax=Popillia japonica TaxID=7064 RepID=A0AAW1JKI4_POPJA
MSVTGYKFGVGNSLPTIDWVTERSRSNWVLVSLLDYKDYLTLTGQNLRILHQKILKMRGPIYRGTELGTTTEKDEYGPKKARTERSRRVPTDARRESTEGDENGPKEIRTHPKT